ncbi:MAG: DNA polymerase I [Porticoccaceae bacterium]|nr:DNA polymerase I [Porticoccaceae bacterium]
MTSSQAPIVLVDGSSYLYRAFHALPPLNNSRGQATGAVKGVISMLRRLQKDYPDSPIVVVFDAKGKTFRDELYEKYKSHRPPMPDDLREQIEPIHNIVRAMGLPLLIIDGVEADDVIGTLAQQSTELQAPVVISTGDKDMAQLVNGHVTLVNTMTDTVLDPAGVEQKFGVPPELIIDFLALMGDSSDNIPGVPGVGEKTALAILQGLGDMDTIYGDLEKVRELSFRGAKKMPEKLAEHKDLAYLSRQLATIKLDVAMELSADQLHNAEADKATLLSLFQDMEFKAWSEELADAAGDSADGEFVASNNQQPAHDKHYTTILSEAELDNWLELLDSAEVFAFDTETTSLNYMQAQLVGVSFAVTPYEAAYVPFGHDYLGAPVQLSQTLVLDRLKPLLENPGKAKLGQNLKYDMSVLAQHGIDLQGIAFDTMLESYVLDATGSRHDMDTLAQKHLDEETVHFTDIAGKGAGQLTFNQIALEEAAPYAAEDADITLRLHQVFSGRLEQEATLLSVYQDIEIPLVPVLSRIERNGAKVDQGLLNTQSAELGKRLGELELQAHDLAGKAFNLASPKQLGVILFEELSLPVIKKTPKGAPSTAEEVLQELALDYPLPKVILEHRSLSKLKSTYTDKLPTMIDPGTGRIHTSYHQAVTATGRLSSSDPNLQNIPIRTEEGRRIRQAFIAPEGHQLVAADYSQIELRIMAHLSGDQGLLEAFKQNLDIHSATAAEVFGTALESVTIELRRNAKAINFGLIYGMSAFGLGRQLNIGRNQAQEYIDLYFSRYPGVREYMDATKIKAADQGYVETLYGRRLYLPQINARNGMQRQAAERTAINAPMQGTAADIIKKAMINVDSWLSEEKLGARMIMQVHDELVLEVPLDEVGIVQTGLKARMETAAQLDVPLIVDIGTGDNWDEAH